MTTTNNRSSQSKRGWAIVGFGCHALGRKVFSSPPVPPAGGHVHVPDTNRSASTPIFFVCSVFKRIYLRLQLSRSIEHSVNLRFNLASCHHVSEVFFVRLFCFLSLSFRHRGCRGNCFPIQKTNTLWSSCHLFWMSPRFFFYLLCLSFFVLNNVFLVWSGENVCLSLRLLVRLSKPFHNQMFQE